MHRGLKLTLGAIVLGSAAAMGAAVARRGVSPVPATAAPPRPVPVVTAPVVQADVPIALTGLGTVEALNKATIRSQVTGYLESVDFTEGQAVGRGDVLARIDPRVYQAHLDQALAQVARDQAQSDNVERNLDRNQPLLQRGFATQQQVADQQAQVAQLAGTLKSDQAAVDDARVQLGFATLRAPFDGVTGLRLVDVGNVIHPTDAGGIVVLAQVQPISVVFTLPSADIPNVRAALARGPVPAIAYDQAGSTRLDAGSLVLIDNQANVASSTVRLKANFPNAHRQLWPGTFVNAEITTSVVKGALTVPVDAIQQNDVGQFVFVVGADGKVATHPVVVGQRVRGTALVSKGLAVGDTVVVQGQYRLVPGSAVVSAPAAQVPDTSTASAGMLP